MIAPVVLMLPAVAVKVKELPDVIPPPLAATLMVPALESVTVVMPVELAARVPALVELTETPPVPPVTVRLVVDNRPVVVTPEAAPEALRVMAPVAVKLAEVILPVLVMLAEPTLPLTASEAAVLVMVFAPVSLNAMALDWVVRLPTEPLPPLIFKVGATTVPADCVMVPVPVAVNVAALFAVMLFARAMAPLPPLVRRLML